jgi:kynurenine 3-monooxygenase
MRKKFDDFLHWVAPSVWVPLYSSVSFSTMPYSKCIENKAWQDRLLNKVLTASGVAATVLVAFAINFVHKSYRNQNEN